MPRTPAIPDWLKQARAERMISTEEVAALFGVSAEEVGAWEEGTPVPTPLIAPLTRWLETGYVPDGLEAAKPRDAYPWPTDPRA
jgi:transcriptional regulator with XRE-family HTH domain